VAGDGIRVCAVAPGITATPLALAFVGSKATDAGEHLSAAASIYSCMYT
jgi:NAD(P)-dependent dehydrogenase (short-subunit alcohol dehydrogenase family)